MTPTCSKNRLHNKGMQYSGCPHSFKHNKRRWRSPSSFNHLRWRVLRCMVHAAPAPEDAVPEINKQFTKAEAEELLKGSTGAHIASSPATSPSLFLSAR
jgi:hypothetical protein